MAIPFTDDQILDAVRAFVADEGYEVFFVDDDRDELDEAELPEDVWDEWRTDWRTPSSLVLEARFGSMRNAFFLATCARSGGACSIRG